MAAPAAEDVRSAPRSAPSALLAAEGLAYAYGGVPAVTDCTLQVPDGRIVALIGTNGAGKSTSVKMIVGALKAQTGSLRFDGAEILGTPAHRSLDMGLVLVPEGRLVFQNLSVLDNLLVSGHSSRGRANLSANLERMFQLFPRLKERAKQNAGSLSGGEQQMLAIARGLMAEPRLLILDEPSLGLSPKLVTTIFDLVRKLNEEGMSVLLVEQNVQQSLAIADYAYVIEKGRVVRGDTGRALLDDPFVKEAYLGLA